MFTDCLLSTYSYIIIKNRTIIIATLLHELEIKQQHPRRKSLVNSCDIFLPIFVVADSVMTCSSTTTSEQYYCFIQIGLYAAAINCSDSAAGALNQLRLRGS